MAKKITIESLALMVQKGFEETAKKADVDKRFERVKAQISDLREEMHEQFRLRELQKA